MGNNVISFKELQDYQQGRTNLHQMRNNRDRGKPEDYHAMYEGDEVVGEIFKPEIQEKIQEALSIREVLQRMGFPTDPVILKEKLIIIGFEETPVNS